MHSHKSLSAMNRIAYLLLASFSLSLSFPLEEDGPRLRDELAERDRDRAAAEAAQYHFASNVQDGISDLTQMREEVRNGLNVKGFYSYSDGHFKRKVTYEADEKGYRIVNEEVQPLKGPRVNPEGKASVRMLAHGNEVSYAVVGDDYTRRRRLEKKLEEQKSLQIQI